MLIPHFSRRMRNPSPTRQAGVVLIIALIVLVALTLAAISLVRSVDTGNLIAGNLAFQQAATRSADAGIEAALDWLQDCTSTHVNCPAGTLDINSDSHTYYVADGATKSPAAGETWDKYWADHLAASAHTMSTDIAGNSVSYVIHRLCDNAGAPSVGATCTQSPTIASASGNEEEANTVQLKALSSVYYRITVRVAGPRNTVSYVQATVSV